MEIQHPSNRCQKASLFQIQFVKVVSRYIEFQKLNFLVGRTKEKQAGVGLRYSVHKITSEFPSKILKISYFKIFYFFG